MSLVDWKRGFAYYTVEDENADDGESFRLSRKRLCQCCYDDDHQLNTIHPLATQKIAQIAKDALAEDCTRRSRDLDGGICVMGHYSIILSSTPIHDA
jgi:hypothetical protein